MARRREQFRSLDRNNDGVLEPLRSGRLAASFNTYNEFTNLDYNRNGNLDAPSGTGRT